MASKSIEERIDDLQKKQAQLKAQEKALKAKKSQAERKARTKRLIEVGAIIEKALDMEFDTPEKREKLLEILTKQRQTNNGTLTNWASYLKDCLNEE
ncbi:MAG: relaxasome subunit MobC [Lachnospiraceae bacterium]|nr:relaxasome subunit MobC [Lachnospiraceae bacterium]